MTNLEETYKSLISVEKLEGLTAEDALEHIGLLTDVSFDLRLTEGLKCAIQLSEELQKRQLNAGQLATLNYFVANAWANLRKLKRLDKDKSWEWEQKETEKEIIHLRLALDEEGLRQLPDERICQILTNLSNHMDYVGRFVEAVEYRDRALAKLPSHSMARGNRGRGLADYARSLYDQGHVTLFLKHAYSDIKIALLSELHEGARNYFDMYRMKIESVMFPEHLNEVFDMCSFSLGSSGQEIQYRQWCLNNKLFLNPLNDLGPFPIAAQDILTTPSIVMDIDKGPYYFGYFNQIKQEFVSARYLYYEGINAKNLHFSDKQVLLYNTLDYPSYSLAIEKVKIAFRMSYSLLDKIAYFLNHYLNLSIPEKNVTFRTFWYESLNKKRGLRQNFQQRKNWPLRGLFWLSKDLYEDGTDFKESIEPDAQELSEIRNHLEHKYLKLHNDFWVGQSASQTLADTLAFSMYSREFVAKTLKLLKMIRAALIYLSLAIHNEERLREKDRGTDAFVPEMPLDVWEDEWKV